MKTNDRQLELGLEGARRCRSSNLRARRRAGWWFERIRQVVDNTEDARFATERSEMDSGRLKQKPGAAAGDR